MYFNHRIIKQSTSVPNTNSSLTNNLGDGSSSEGGTNCCERLSYIYSCIVLALLWLNVVRLVTIFTSKDELDAALLTKVVSYLWVITCTLMHTSYFVACHTGDLHNIIDELAIRSNRKLTDKKMKIDRNVTMQENGVINKKQHTSVIDVSSGDSLTRSSPISDYTSKDRNLHLTFVKRRIIVCTLVAWIVTIVNSIFVSYVLMATSIMDSHITPVNTYIFISNSVPLKIVYMIILVYISAAWSFPPAMTFFVSVCIGREFTSVNRLFEESLVLNMQSNEDRGGELVGRVEWFRIRHQKVAQLVSRADTCLCFFYSSSFIGHIAVAVLTLYVVIFFPEFRATPLVTVVGMFWIIISLCELAVASAGAVTVSNAVSRPIAY